MVAQVGGTHKEECAQEEPVFRIPVSRDDLGLPQRIEIRLSRPRLALLGLRKAALALSAAHGLYAQGGTVDGGSVGKGFGGYAMPNG